MLSHLTPSRALSAAGDLLRAVCAAILLGLAAWCVGVATLI